MYRGMGYGLATSFEDIMEMPVRWKNRLFEMLCEQLEREMDAMKGGGND